MTKRHWKGGVVQARKKGPIVNQQMRIAAACLEGSATILHKGLKLHVYPRTIIKSRCRANENLSDVCGLFVLL